MSNLFSLAKDTLEKNYAGTGLSFMSSDNPMYDAYYKANPYVNQTYHKTLWDELFSGIFRTGYDKWLNEMQLNSDQYNAGVVDLQQQNEYNSEVAQAQRMRDAGENPDMLGTEGVSDAAKTAPDPQDAQIPEAMDVSQVASFAGMIAQCFQGALGMASAGIDLIGKVSQIDSQNISNASSMQDLALQYIRNNIPSQGLVNDADYVSWKEKLAALSQPDVAWNESLARSLGLKRHQRSAFDSALNSAIGSLPSELERFKMEDEYASNKLSVARKTSSSFYDESFEVMKGLSAELVAQSDALEAVKARVAVLEQDVEEARQNNELTQQGITDQYLTYASEHAFGRQQGIIEGENFNITKEQQALTRQQNEIDKILKQTRKNILDMLQGMADDGNSFANYMIYNMMLHEYMNFNFKTSFDLGAGIGKVLPKNMKGWIPNFGLGLDAEAGISF